MQRILIVEDDTALSNGIALAMKKEEFEFIQCFDKKSAERAFASQKFELIILDINLPDGSGLDFCQMIRKRSDVPIIFLTANDMEIDVVTGFEIGADDYITKPFSLAILRARILAQLRKNGEKTKSGKYSENEICFDFDAMLFIKDGTVYTLTGSFDMDKFVSKFIDVDFQIAHAAYFKNKFRNDTPVSKTTISAIEEQKSFDRGGLIYNIPEIKIISKYDGNVEYEAGKMYLPDGSSVPIADIYAMDDFVLENLEIVKGSYDKNKFKTGKFLLLGLTADDNGNIMYNKALYSIGEKVKLKVLQDDFNTNFDGAKEYEVMGYYRMRSTNCSRRYGSVAFAMPLEELRTYDKNPVPMTYICNAKAGKEDELEAFIKSYTESVEIQMSYNSRETYKKEFEDLQNMILSIGGVLCLIIGIIGILNFINSVFTSIIARRSEFAMMESVGMTKVQLRKMLIYEGLYCGFFTIAISFILTGIFTFGVLSQFSKAVWFMSYKFVILPLLIAYPVLLALSVLIPYLAFRGVGKQSVVERLRIAE